MVPDINIWAVLVATVASMVVGMVWYTPKTFGSAWMRLARVEPGQGKSIAGPLIVSAIAAFITAWVLAGSAFIAQEFYGGSFLANTLITGVILWAGFTLARFFTHDAFEGRPAALTLLNAAHELVAVLAMGLVIGLFGV
ncbi:DUF1761 domain-containing protein [Zhihengliuella sp.]|uniref:DUF1761 domain-containing protein n=1 Tax=Zhihengliuella sp. TaxID=1954483 RepID=UPI0028124793|nr:DUF1761 domain-containing protein [Zhihengliuella sp.]